LSPHTEGCGAATPSDRESDLAAEREQIQREQDILQDWYDVDINLAPNFN